MTTKTKYGKGRARIYVQEWYGKFSCSYTIRFRVIYPSGLVEYTDIYDSFRGLDIHGTEGCTSRDTRKAALKAVSRYFKELRRIHGPLIYVASFEV